MSNRPLLIVRSTASAATMAADPLTRIAPAC
jgi:hypothetical protein